MKTDINQRLRSSEIVRSVHAGGNLNNDGQAGVTSRNSPFFTTIKKINKYYTFT